MRLCSVCPPPAAPPLHPAFSESAHAIKPSAPQTEPALPRSFVAAGFVTSWLGAFGHNWVHQPRYKSWAYLSLDTIGFSSDGWFREHVLQHHMYTNTPWDNHFKGTDPFLTTDPTVKRNWVQCHLMPYLNPLLRESPTRAGTSLCTCLYTRHIHERQVHLQLLD